MLLISKMKVKANLIVNKIQVKKFQANKILLKIVNKNMMNN